MGFVSNLKLTVKLLGCRGESCGLLSVMTKGKSHSMSAIRERKRRLYSNIF